MGGYDLLAADLEIDNPTLLASVELESEEVFSALVPGLGGGSLFYGSSSSVLVPGLGGDERLAELGKKFKAIEPVLPPGGAGVVV